MPIVLLMVGFIVFVRNSFSAQAPTQTVSYIRSGPYDSAGWSIFIEYLSPISVTANNTGVIPQMPTLSSLTDAEDAAYHQVNQYDWHPPTGWFWDADNSLLYILSIDDGKHPVKLSMVFPLAASTTGTVTVTITETVTSTVTYTSTVTATVVSAQTVTVTTTTTTTRTCTIVCLP